MAIQSFSDFETEAFFREGLKPKAGWQAVLKVAARKLDMVHAAAKLTDLKIPPNNKLHPLEGDRAGQYAIWINDQWRVCFRWTDAGPTDVHIADYH